MEASGLVTITGLLRRDGAGFVLLGDDGARYPLELGRMPVNLVAKRAQVTGERLDGGALAVTGLAPA